MENKKTVIVTAAIIEKNGKYLIAKRKMDCRNSPGKWEFPGGKLEFGEKPEECITREIKEELDVEIKPTSLFSVTTTIDKIPSPCQIIVIAYKCKFVSGTIKNIDCDDSKWVTKEEFSKFTFTNPDLEIIEKLLKE